MVYLCGSSSSCLESDGLQCLGRHVKASEVEANPGAESVPISKASGGVFDPLDPRVDAFGSGVGDAVIDGVDQTLEAPPDHLGDLAHRCESRSDGPAVPAPQSCSVPNLRSGISRSP